MWFYNYFPFMAPFMGKITEKKLVQFENDLAFRNTLIDLINLALDRVKFEGLPKTCNERYFKTCLLLSGSAMIVKDKELGYLSLGAVPDGERYNIYGEYAYVYGYGWNGFNKRYSCYMYGTDNSDAEAVICWDNYYKYPLINYLIVYAERLSNTMRTLDVTARKLKTPYFIVCDESQKSSVKKILDDIDFNIDSIITNKSTTPNMFQVLPTNIREGALQSLWNHYNNLESKARSKIGINSATNQDKRERLLKDEVNSDNEIAQLELEVQTNNYDIFCKTVNEHFGLNISYKINKVLNDKLISNEPISDTGGDNNESQ